MDDSTLKNRRRFLESVSVGGAMLLAGCTDQLSLGESDLSNSQNGSQEGTTEATGDAAVIAALDREAIQKEQAAIQKDVENGDMNRTEARTKMVELQEKYVTKAIDSLTGTLQETDGVTVGKTYQSLAAVTVEGDAGAILSVLDSDDVNALVSVADVEAQVKRQQTQA
ncbi:hypothetical protein [Halogeometricum borinquense]|uniref:hypothetical protein n=1 Tax=Halogeometricum borinquense TaxID=60847 RepID=UPI003437AF35